MNASAKYEGLFPPWIKKVKKGYCDFLSHNSAFLEILSLCLTILTFFLQIWGKKNIRIVSYKLRIARNKQFKKASQNCEI